MDGNGCSNLRSRRFNNVSMWVASSIVKVTKLKARAKLMARMIKIAEVRTWA